MSANRTGSLDRRQAQCEAFQREKSRSRIMLTWPISEDSEICKSGAVSKDRWGKCQQIGQGIVTPIAV